MPLSKPLTGAVLALLSSGLLQAASSLELINAARGGDAQTVRSLLIKGADPKTTDVDGTTALHWVVRAGDLESAGLLIKNGADVSALDRYGIAPLHLACINGDVAMVALLLDARANPNYANPDGQTALMTASRTGSVGVMKLLLDRGAVVDAVENVRSQTALMWAVGENHPDAVKFLLERGANINAQSDLVKAGPGRQERPGQAAGAGITRQKSPPAPEGLMTPLLYASRDGNLEMVQLLVSSGANVNLNDANGTSPLLLALINGHMDIARFLLEHGANPNATDGFGRAPLFGAVDLRDAGFYGNASAGPNQTDTLDLIGELVKQGAKLDAQTTAVVPFRGWQQTDGAWVNVTGQTPFFRAAFAGDIVLMRFLLAAGADPNIATRDGTTSLMAASGINYVVGRTYTHSPEESFEAVKLCVEKGADVNAKNSLGLRAVHGAANRGSDDILRFLVSKGAQLGVKDNEGRTPMTYAEGVFLAVNPPSPKPSTIALIGQLQK
jgi:uncharacterized protein